jgi:hypothetical protein
VATCKKHKDHLKDEVGVRVIFRFPFELEHNSRTGKSIILVDAIEDEITGDVSP